MLESDYTHAESPKRAPELPLRVFNKSQLIAALRQHSRPIVIEDPDLALPFIRMLRARLTAVGIRRDRAALAYRSICTSRERASSYPKAEGSSASYARLGRVGAFAAEIPSIVPAFYHSRFANCSGTDAASTIWLVV